MPIPRAPWLNKLLRLAAVVSALLALTVLYVLVVGVRVDASAFRPKIAATLTATLGREVRFAGPLQIEISARPKLMLGGLHIANATGFSAGEFASLGEANLALDLWPLLWQKFQVEALTGADVTVHLQQKTDSSNNWTFKSASAKTEPTKREPSARVELGRVLSHLDIQRIALSNLNVEFIGTNQQSHYFELQSLVAQFPAGKPITFTLHGAVEKQYPYQLEFTGGTLADLAHFDAPWPIDLSLKFMSSHLNLNGEISGDGGEVKFGLGTEDLGEFERLFQTKLPAVGVTGIAGVVKYSPSKTRIEALTGVMGKTTLSGELEITYGQRTKLQGTLALPTLDLRPFMTDKPKTQESPPKSMAEVYQEIVQASFSLKALNEMDTDLTLRVDHWLSLPGDVRDAVLQVKLAQGRLSVPMQITVADATLQGKLAIDARSSTSRFSLGLGMQHSDLGNLADVLAGVPGVQGKLARFDFQLRAQGDRGAQLMENLDLRLNIERGDLSYGNQQGERPVRFMLDNFAIALPAGKPLRGEMHGVLLDTAFDARLSGGKLTEMMQQANTPVDFAMRAGTARVELHAQLNPATQDTGSEVSFEIDAPHSGEIAGWLGLRPKSDAPIHLQGNYLTRSGQWRIDDLNVRLGRTRLGMQASRVVELHRPLLRLALHSEHIDVAELQSLLPESKPAPVNPSPAKQPRAAMIDIPILPHGIDLADADIQVRLQKIDSGSPLTVSEVSFDGRIRDGMMYASPFSANVADAPFGGALLLDLRSQEPKADVWLAADALDIGKLLNTLGIARNLEAGVEQVRVHLDLHASKLGQLLAQSTLALEFDGGYLTLQDANTGNKMRVALDHGELSAAPGKPVGLMLMGGLDQVPVVIGIETAKAVDLISPTLSIPFKLNVATSESTLQLSGDIDRPLADKDVELALEMRGTRFDRLNALTHSVLPPWGPWEVTGKFHMSSRGYELPSLLLKVGSSQLTGTGKFDTKMVPPRLDVTLTAPSIQLDDFKMPGGEAKPKKNAQNTAAIKTVTAEKKEKPEQTLSREVLQRQDAFLKVRVDQVLSGADHLGSGRLDATLQDGKAELTALVNTLGGAASMQMVYQPREKDIAVKLRMEAKDFDYGVLARRVDKKSEMRGVFSLDVDVNANTPDFEQTLRYGKGHVDFAVWPENLKSGLLDVWAVNVLMALLPAVDSSSESKVNCAIARFALADGRLAEKGIVIDTTRMRVTGKGAVDFNKDEIDLYVKPRAKTPQFLSLAIPIEVSGKFDDFHVGVRTSDVVGTVGQLATSVIWVPLEMMFGKETPADGRDVCGKTAFTTK